ncbi:MAG: 50S ribosomal protein L25 [Bacteroidales bacterium]|nr:50S ribosomal protein L25 [Bacteroidales bacterium]MDD4670516.1 50S ribosomal protein L25 [Bacteroidales bacterium]
MKQITIEGKLRTTGRKADVNSVRRSQRVPCVLYGQGVENISFSIDAKELKTITDTPYSHIINLNIEGTGHLAVLHDVQYHPVTDEASHVDFLAVSETKPVVINVPIKITGNSEGVKQGGKLLVSARKLRVSGLIENLPDELVVDITTLQLGKQIAAGDLNYEGIQIVSPKSTIICAVRMTRAVVVDDSAAAATTAAPQA